MARVMIGVPDSVAGLVETIDLVGAMDAAVEQLTAALEGAARRLDGTGDPMLAWDVSQALSAGETARARARPIVRRLAERA